MSTATSLATHRITGRTVRISGRTKTSFVGTGNNFNGRNETQPMPDNFIKIANTCVTTARISHLIDETCRPIVSIVGGATTRPERIDTRSTMISETYKSTVGRIEMGLLAQ